MEFVNLFKNFCHYRVHLRVCILGNFYIVRVLIPWIRYSHLLTALSTGVSTCVLVLVGDLFALHHPC